MNHLDSLLERNRQFAAEQFAAGTLMPSLPRALPNVKAIIVEHRARPGAPLMVFQLRRDLRDTSTSGLPVAWTR